MEIIIFEFYVLYKTLFYLFFQYSWYLTWNIDKIWYRLMYIFKYVCVSEAFGSKVVKLHQKLTESGYLHRNKTKRLKSNHKKDVKKKIANSKYSFFLIV